MADAVQPRFIRRLLSTPLLDLLRGRISGAKSARRRAVDDAMLPPATRLLVQRVVKRTRLWRGENHDVAAELVAHFADGLEAGATPEELTSSFGDERQAARLIRRAKLRNRPLAWHVMRFARRFVVALVLIYAVLVARFYLGKPHVSVDYLARLNAPIEQTPADQRAWPLYVEAMAKLDWPNDRERANPASKHFDVGYADRFDKRLSAKPGGKRWDELCAWIDAHAADVELLRKAAAKPALGFVLGPNGSQRDLPFQMSGADPSLGLVGVLLPFLNEQRRLATVLVADIRVARERKQGERIVRDFEALLAMGEQVRDPFLVSQLVVIGVENLALDALDETLSTAPQALSDGELVRSAHVLARGRAKTPGLELAGESLMFEDIMQRTFTDDGTGDGRLTPAGFRMLYTLSTVGQKPSEDWPQVAMSAMVPAGAVASRREQLAEHARLMNLAAAQIAKLAREADWLPYINRLDELKSSAVEGTRYLPILMLTPSLSHVHMIVERSLGQREGLMVAIALELHRRRTGSYPPALDALVPGLLPAIPADRITGSPVRYKLVEGKPVVYSVGVDRDDDGGRPPRDRNGQPATHLAADWPLKAEQRPGKPNLVRADGDWPLYPQPPAAEPEEPEEGAEPTAE